MASSVLEQLQVMLGMDASEFITGSTSAQREVGRLQDSIRSLGDKWMSVGRNLTIGVTAPLTAFGLLSAKVASDAEELQSAFDQTFGDMSREMNSWAVQTGDAMGRSTQAMQDMANTFGIFFNQAAGTRAEAAEMSKTFAVLAQDLSSFYNVAEGTALQKLRSGLAGEAEPLRDFGVFLTEATVKAKAMEMGLADASGAISEQAKIMARYQLILESTTNAQGDVARTSGGAANQWRAFTEAIRELQVAIGEKLLPVLTPLIGMATRVVNAFTNLPSGVQTAIIAFGALAAAIGPMMLMMGTLAATVLPFFAASFGPVGIAISAFVNPLGTAISFLAGFVAQMAGMTILRSIGAMLLRFAGPVGLVASAGLLIYQNWERIAPILREFWGAANESIGGPLRELIGNIIAKFEELWGGPLGEGIRTVMEVLGEFGGVVWAILGDALIETLQEVVNIAKWAFGIVGAQIEFINALLFGDWQDVWNAALGIVEAIVPGITGAVTAIYNGVKTWLQDRLGAVFEWVREKVEMVEGAFAWLYDRVVGNSWVPDMVSEIGASMAGLARNMVNPAQRAANDTSEAFEGMGAQVESAFANMAQNALGSLQGLVQGIKSGGVLDIIGGLLGVLQGFGVIKAPVAAAGGGGGGWTQASTPPGFPSVDASALQLSGTSLSRVSSGAVAAGKAANDRGGPAVVNNYYTLPSDEFWGRVDGKAVQVVAAAAPHIASMGANEAMGRIGRANSKRLG